MAAPAIESVELHVAVGPQSDARLADLFDGPCPTVVRTALEREQAQPRGKVVNNAMESFGLDAILLVEAHGLCEDGEGRGELVLSFPPPANLHLLGAFAQQVRKPSAPSCSVAAIPIGSSLRRHLIW